MARVQAKRLQAEQAKLHEMQVAMQRKQQAEHAEHDRQRGAGHVERGGHVKAGQPRQRLDDHERQQQALCGAAQRGEKNDRKGWAHGDSVGF
jgi:hypothetical protein